jgi:hypothetical protein
MADNEKYPVKEPIREKIIGSLDKENVKHDPTVYDGDPQPVTTDPVEGANYKDGEAR